MKAPFSTLIMAALLLCCLNSCKKYLDEKYDKKQVVPVRLEDLQGMLDNDIVMNNTRTAVAGESSADDYFLLEPDLNRTEDYVRIYTWTGASMSFPNDWANGYVPVYTSNYCLEQLSKISQSAENGASWNNIKGSSLFFRAYYFFQSALNYAKAYDPVSAGTDYGIVLRVVSDFNAPSKRATVAETYDHIIKDAKEALSFLPERPLITTRPSRTAVYGLLSRVYLSMRQYDSAHKYADLTLQIKADLMDYNNDPDLLSATGNVPFKRFNRETIFYTEMSTEGPIHPSFAKVDSNLRSSYAVKDLRDKIFFRPVGNYWRFKGSYAENQSILFSGIATDELFLTRAECLARKGATVAALDDLNTLMIQRWEAGSFVPFTASDAAEALQLILKERRKELLMRGLRWMDIKRLNKEGANIVVKRLVDGQTLTLEPNANWYALPLPADIIAITGIPQNPK